MKLSDVVAYLNLLDSVDVDQETGVAVRKLNAVLHMVTNHDLQVNTCTQDLTQVFESVNNSLKDFNQVLEQIKQGLTQLLHAQEPAYLAESFRLFDQEMKHNSVQYVLNRILYSRKRIDIDSDAALRFRLKNLATWSYPGMIIGPGTETFIEDMVSLDPLYVVDTHQELIDPAIRIFTQEYQRRLRQYIVNDRIPDAIFNKFPDNQFGVIFAYNYFNYRPIEVIQRYIQEIASKLRPGGTFIMTYNNCDKAHGVALAERAQMLYTPKRLIMQHAAAAGLEYISDSDGPGDVSWIEFARPGKLETIRGGQSLAKIIAQAA
jgi:SAM-dependent methyltransferase